MTKSSNDAADDRTIFRRQFFRTAAGGAFLLLLVAIFAAIGVAIVAGRVERSTADMLRVRQTESSLFSLIQDAETGQRGYLLTKDESYLAPFNQAKENLPAAERVLFDLIAADSAQQTRLALLTTNIAKKMDELARTVALTEAGNYARALALVTTGEGRDLMVQIRRDSDAFDNAELRTLGNQQASAKQLRSLLLILIIAALILTAGLCFIVGREGRNTRLELAGQNLALRREMADHRRTEAKLHQAQKMEAVGQLTGGIAHDFNNMLAVIIGNLDLALRRMPEGLGRTHDMVENALNGAISAAALTKRLLAFSRLQPLDPQALNLNQCVSDMSEMIRRTLSEDISIETVLAGGLWRTFVDRAQVESALLNLAVNARDAMPDGGRLTIETANAVLDEKYAEAHDDVEPGQYVMVALTDTGKGMAPDILEKAYDPFFTTKDVGQGTGLGLSQVHGFVKQSQGHIKLYSEIGVGTTVKLYFRRDVTSDSIPDRIYVHAPHVTSQRFTILIVEDDPSVRAFVLSAVKELGYNTVEADRSEVALKCLEQNPDIALLLTDIVMAGGSGRQLADQALSMRPDLRVVYMTGYTSNAVVHNGQLDAGTRLLTKPFTVDDLRRELTSALKEL